MGQALARTLRLRNALSESYETMPPTNLLVVERNADWSQWTSLSRSLSTAVLMLVQQPDESCAAFHERICRRLARGKRVALEAVVWLRSRATLDEHSNPSDVLFAQLGAKARLGLRIYPRTASA